MLFLGGGSRQLSCLSQEGGVANHVTFSQDLVHLAICKGSEVIMCNILVSLEQTTPNTLNYDNVYYLIQFSLSLSHTHTFIHPHIHTHPHTYTHTYIHTPCVAYVAMEHIIRN